MHNKLSRLMNNNNKYINGNEMDIKIENCIKSK